MSSASGLVSYGVSSDDDVNSVDEFVIKEEPTDLDLENIDNSDNLILTSIKQEPNEDLEPDNPKIFVGSDSTNTDNSIITMSVDPSAENENSDADVHIIPVNGTNMNGLHSNKSALTGDSVDVESTNLKRKSMEDCDVNQKNDLWIIDNDYRDISSSDTESSSEDESSSSLSDSLCESGDDDEVQEIRVEQSKLGNKTEKKIKKNPFLDYDFNLPPIEDLQISVEEEESKPIGTVFQIVDDKVVIQGYRDMAAIDLDSVLFLDKGSRALGKVFDVFGPVNEPLYVVRFNSSTHVKQKDIQIGAVVYFAPQTDHTSFVVIEELMRIPGSDASWKKNKEVPLEMIDFSDDEEERTIRRGKQNSTKQPTDYGGEKKRIRNHSNPFRSRFNAEDDFRNSNQRYSTHDDSKFRNRFNYNRNYNRYNPDVRFGAPADFRSAPSPMYPNAPSPCPMYPNQPSPSPMYPNAPSPCPMYRNQPSPSPMYRNQPSPSPMYPNAPSPSPMYPNQQSPSPMYPNHPEFVSFESTPIRQFCSTPPPAVSPSPRFPTFERNGFGNDRITSPGPFPVNNRLPFNNSRPQPLNTSIMFNRPPPSNVLPSQGSGFLPCPPPQNVTIPPPISNPSPMSSNPPSNVFTTPHPMVNTSECRPMQNYSNVNQNTNISRNFTAPPPSIAPNSLTNVNINPIRHPPPFSNNVPQPPQLQNVSNNYNQPPPQVNSFTPPVSSNSNLHFANPPPVHVPAPPRYPATTSFNVPPPPVNHAAQQPPSHNPNFYP